MNTYLPIGIHRDHRMVLESEEYGTSTYPARSEDSPTMWFEVGPVPDRARKEHRITVAFTLPWIPRRWRYP